MTNDTPSPTPDAAPAADPPANVTPVGVDPLLLSLLVCPLTKGPLVYDRERQELVSEQAGLAYPIKDGIPIMLPDEARATDGDDPIPPEVRADPEAPAPGTPADDA